MAQKFPDSSWNKKSFLLGVKSSGTACTMADADFKLDVISVVSGTMFDLLPDTDVCCSRQRIFNRHESLHRF
jgi:hypothetical protein